MHKLKYLLLCFIILIGSFIPLRASAKPEMIYTAYVSPMILLIGGNPTQAERFQSGCNVFVAGAEQGDKISMRCRAVENGHIQGLCKLSAGAYGNTSISIDDALTTIQYTIAYTATSYAHTIVCGMFGDNLGITRIRQTTNGVTMDVERIVTENIHNSYLPNATRMWSGSPTN